MGEFAAGKWIVVLSLYFFAFFLVVFGSLQAANAMGVDHSIQYTAPGFLGEDPTEVDVADSVDPSEAFSWSGVRDTLTIMTGFSTSFGIPGVVQFIFSFLFFWIPFLMLLWSIYMAIPIIH